MLILSHIGDKFPNYIEDSLTQTRKFYDGDITFVSNLYDKKLENKYNIKFFNVDFNNEKFIKSKNINFNKFPSTNFWLYSLARLFFIEEFVVSNKIEKFVIYENDIMIYVDLNYIIKLLSKEYKNIAFTIGDDIRATTGFSYFSNYKDLVRLNDDIMDIISSPDKMKDIYNNYSSCCPSEMVFIRKIVKDKNYIEPLPLLPTDDKFNTLGYLFDPAAYGQFLGGSPKENGNVKKFVDKSTYIGKEIIKKNISVSFELDNSGIKKPFCVKNGKKYKICNLHIHSKQLKQFATK